MEKIQMNKMEKAPGFVKHPDHKVLISLSENRYKVSYNGVEIANSAAVMILQENNYPARPYFPAKDVDVSALTKETHSTYCPFKGTASYWRIASHSDQTENAVWAYEKPYEECASIAGYFCFYTEKPLFELEILTE
jgi:uncharacterized protein (DUF427 family)